MNLGKHISFYYYGEDHMIINLYKYIKDSIGNNNFVFLDIEDYAFELLLDSLNETEKYMIGKINIENIIISNNKNNSEFIKKCMLNYKLQKKDQGFTNVKFIFDARRIIENTSKELFKSFASYCFDVIVDEKVDILTVYDFGEYMTKGRYINDEIIRVSYMQHSHRMFANEVLSIDEFENEKHLA
jgi:MEDS: MEthanogen/methylotroph, DcmR Sensory domain